MPSVRRRRWRFPLWLTVSPPPRTEDGEHDGSPPRRDWVGAGSFWVGRIDDGDRRPERRGGCAATGAGPRVAAIRPVEPDQAARGRSSRGPRYRARLGPRQRLDVVP